MYAVNDCSLCPASKAAKVTIGTELLIEKASPISVSVGYGKQMASLSTDSVSMMYRTISVLRYSISIGRGYLHVADTANQKRVSQENLLLLPAPD